MKVLLAIGLFGIWYSGQIATPDSSPEAASMASPAAVSACDGVDVYFETIEDLLSENKGYRAVQNNPAGTFGLPADQNRAIASSLEALINELDEIDSPAAAIPFHLALIDQIGWYRDLVTASDLTTHQRIVNRDKQLVPAMSRAMIAGQSACGYETWIDAYDRAFGDTP
ncbi:MAG: hypothetical protein WKF81_07115 [Thermomicrobiales bacterium]